MIRLRLLAAIALVSFFAALGGVVVGRRLIPPVTYPHMATLNQILDSDLDLDNTQRRQVAILAKRFDQRHRVLMAQMRTDNALLARAIRDGGQDRARINEAISRTHQTMGAVQGDMVEYVLDVRRLLRPGQVARFDRQVTATLTAHP